MAPDLVLGRLFHTLLCEISFFKMLHSPSALIPRPCQGMLVVLRAQGGVGKLQLLLWAWPWDSAGGVCPMAGTERVIQGAEPGANAPPDTAHSPTLGRKPQWCLSTGWTASPSTAKRGLRTVLTVLAFWGPPAFWRCLSSTRSQGQPAMLWLGHTCTVCSRFLCSLSDSRSLFSFLGAFPHHMGHYKDVSVEDPA